jgi:hypothetical protein
MQEKTGCYHSLAQGKEIVDYVALTDPDVNAVVSSLKLTAGDVVVIDVRGDQWKVKDLRELAKGISDAVGFVQIIVLPHGISLTTMDESLMNKAGWIKASSMSKM